MISIHAPREGCDGQAWDGIKQISEFQSTHPVRGATKTGLDRRTFTKFQSTHPVRGATWNA